MLKKVIIIGVILIVLGAIAFMLVPWGEYESKLEKSEIEKVVELDSTTGEIIPSMSLIEGKYSVESGENSHAEITFQLDGLKDTKGGFDKFSIDLKIPEAYTESKLKVEIQAKSINTGNEMRDEHLLEEDFFDTKKFPKITFESEVVEFLDSSYVAKGNLTLLKETKPLEVPFKHLGAGKNDAGKEFEAFEGTFSFDRIAFGMKESASVGNIVTVSFYCELIKK